MWIPKSVEELEHAVTNGDVEETSTLDFKEIVSEKSKDLAKDIAAMANDGGVLIYGIGEDDAKKPVLLRPFRLEGAAERVHSIIGSCLSPTPKIEISPLRLEDGTGYLVVVVPTSPLAPHLVIVGGENRFWGRNGNVNRALDEGDIARLYERRKRWEVDREAQLDRAIESAPHPPTQGLGYIHAFSRPVASDEMLFRSVDVRTLLAGVLKENSIFSGEYPYFDSNQPRPLPGGWYFYMNSNRADRRPDHSFDLEFLHDGSSRLFFGRAAATSRAITVVFPPIVGSVVSRYLYLMGLLYKSFGFYGQVDLGVAVTGIRGAVPDQSFAVGPGFADDCARGTLRIGALDLATQAKPLTEELLFKFCHGFGLDPAKLIRST